MARNYKTISQAFGVLGLFAGRKDFLMSHGAGKIAIRELQMLEEKLYTYRQLCELTNRSQSSVAKK